MTAMLKALQEQQDTLPARPGTPLPPSYARSRTNSTGSKHRYLRGTEPT